MGMLKGNEIYHGKFIITSENGFGVTVHDTLKQAKAKCTRIGDQVTLINQDPSKNRLMYTCAT